ncbi:ATP-binding protein [Roseicyclus sp. F158]|uniref:histidine kinase n=1 Tax=Tropicimonas omnivorans TaxID=3075590 RepID=A0ABU3DK57_9RHOB|nr:ATP-binding protein [Roseicyclus sp. F158]MDT0684099.1 ATP-binding protein [Roseicyclus sp. F158]
MSFPTASAFLVGGAMTSLVYFLTPVIWDHADSAIPPTLTRETLLFGILACTGFLLAFLRGIQAIRLQNKLLLRKDEELVIHNQAISEHAIVDYSDPTGTIFDINENFAQVFGYSREEIIGKSTAVLYPEEKSALFEEILGHLAAGKTWAGEQTLVTKSGESRSMQCSIVPLNDSRGNHIRSVAIRTDVTASRRAEAYQQQTTLLDELSDEVFIICSVTFTLIYANAKARHHLAGINGWGEDEWKNKSVEEAFHNFDRTEFRDRVASLHDRTRTSLVYETDHMGEPVEVNVQIINEPFDKPAYVAVVRDISERKEVEAAKRAFVSTVSHELRTPLTAIKGALGLARAGVTGQLPERAQPVIDIAYRNSERLLLVVNDMLDLEKIEAGKMDFVCRTMDLAGFLKESMEINGGYGDEFGVSFEGEGLDDGPRQVIANADRLMQVVSNLLSNACKYSSPGSAVKIALSDAGIDWRISVTDTGPGISEDQRDQVFEKFSQVRPTDGKPRVGTGLGLSIVKAIVERHDGRIDFESDVGYGTTFFVDLPKAEIGSERKVAAE